MECILPFYGVGRAIDDDICGLVSKEDDGAFESTAFATFDFCGDGESSHAAVYLVVALVDVEVFQLKIQGGVEGVLVAHLRFLGSGALIGAIDDIVCTVEEVVHIPGGGAAV